MHDARAARVVLGQVDHFDDRDDGLVGHGFGPPAGGPPAGAPPPPAGAPPAPGRFCAPAPAPALPRLLLPPPPGAPKPKILPERFAVAVLAEPVETPVTTWSPAFKPPVTTVSVPSLRPVWTGTRTGCPLRR